MVSARLSTLAALTVLIQGAPAEPILLHFIAFNMSKDSYPIAKSAFQHTVL